MSMIWTFDSIEDKHGRKWQKLYEKCFESLREHAMKIINFEKKKMLPLNKGQKESYER